jgi:hypothetical protein
MTYSIIYRDVSTTPSTRVLAETDRREQAVAILEIVVLQPFTHLIDYSPNLDGSIDELLWTGQPPVEKAA